MEREIEYKQREKQQKRRDLWKLKWEKSILLMQTEPEASLENLLSIQLKIPSSSFIPYQNIRRLKLSAQFAAQKGEKTSYAELTTEWDLETCSTHRLLRKKIVPEIMSFDPLLPILYSWEWIVHTLEQSQCLCGDWIKIKICINYASIFNP